MLFYYSPFSVSDSCAPPFFNPSSSTLELTPIHLPFSFSRTPELLTIRFYYSGAGRLRVQLPFPSSYDFLPPSALRGLYPVETISIVRKICAEPLRHLRGIEQETNDVDAITEKQQKMTLDGRRVKKPKYDCLEANLKLKESKPDANLDKSHGVGSILQVPQHPNNTLHSSCDPMKEEDSNDGDANTNPDTMEKSTSLLVENKHETCPQEAKCLSDGPTRSNSLPVAQRGSRKAKKQRHGDMAYAAMLIGRSFYVNKLFLIGLVGMCIMTNQLK